MKILIKNKKVLDALVDELEGKLEIMLDDMPNLMGDYVEAAWENLQDRVYCNFRDDGREYCEGHIKPEDLPDAF